MTSNARRTAVFAAIHTHYMLNGTGSEPLPEPDRALVVYAPIIVCTLLILMSAIMVGVCLLMREKRKRIQEAVSLANLPWLDTLEVFAVSGRDGAAGIFMPPPTPGGTPSPPPAYDSVVTNNEKAKEAKAQEKNTLHPPTSRLLPPIAPPPPPHTEEATPPPPEESAPPQTDDLPTYEAAVKMEGHM